MAQVTDTLAAQLTALVESQRDVLARMEQIHAQVAASALQPAVARLHADVQAAADAGTTVDAAWVQAHPEYVALLAEIEADLNATVPVVAAITAVLIVGALTAGEDDTDELLTLAGLASIGRSTLGWPSLEDRARTAGVAQRRAAAARHRSAVGRSRPVSAVTITDPVRSSVHELVDAHIPEHLDRIQDTLVEGLVQGWHPERIAREIQHVAQELPAAEAMLVARTEQMRSYRAVIHEAHQAHPGITEWVWVARCNRRTCAYCWAMHGTVHTATEPMATHPNCMCLPVPVLPSIVIVPGTELFAALPDEDQVYVLGPAAADAYREGLIGLQDLAEQGEHPVWGPVGRRRSLRAALERAAS